MDQPLKFGVKCDYKDWAAKMRAIGSQEIPRAIQFALDETAKWAVVHFRDDVMPAVLGHRKSDSWSPYAGKLSSRTRNAVSYDRSRKRSYDDVKDVRDIKSSIFIQAQQGTPGKDQSSYLKFQFGYGSQVRTPGDVGMSNDVILIPLGWPLAIAEKIGGSMSGRQPANLLKTLESRIVPSSGLTRAQVMKKIAASRGGQKNAHWDSMSEAERNAALARGRLSSRLYTQTRSPAARAEEAKRGPWPVFRGQDPHSGLKTYFARPPRIKDPSGGVHTFRRRDGTVGRMPDMINLALGFGAAGSDVGPYRLLAAEPRVRYDPKLQRPWEETATFAATKFREFLEGEYEHRLGRAAQGRRY